MPRYDQVHEAVSLLEKVVNICEQTLAEDHPDRLASELLHSTIYWKLENHQAAMQIMHQVVEIRRQTDLVSWAPGGCRSAAEQAPIYYLGAKM